MISRSILLVLFTFIFYQFSVSQNISGTVLTSLQKEAANVNVLLLKAADSSMVKGAITDSKGKYIFKNVSAGKYQINYSSVGFLPITGAPFTISNLQKEIVIENIFLKEERQELQQVTVTAKKPMFEQKIDRMIVNVKNTITASGGSALDILERSPGVIVDRQGNTITMNGKNGVVVMINGKMNRMPIDAVMQMLQGMSSANIEKIELINTPPSNYDAEGNAGFINIVLVENTDYGTNGNYTASAGYGGREKLQGSMNINYRTGKINVYGDGSFFRNHMQQQFTTFRQFYYAGKTLSNGSDSQRDPVQTNSNGRIGFDYEINKRTAIGGILSTYYNQWSMDANIIGTTYKNQVLDTLINIFNTEENNWKNISANLNVQHTIAAGQKLSVSVDYLDYNNSNPNTYINNYTSGNGNLLYTDRVRSSKETPMNIWVGAFDYTQKINTKIDWEAGVKATRSRFINDVAINRMINNSWEIDPSLSAIYFLKENIMAAYSSLNVAWNENTSMKLGLRYEHTTSNLETATQKNIVDRNYGEFFPSVFLSRKISDRQSINLSYNRRITRPTFNQLAPFVYFLDPSTFIQGNPALQPSFSQSIKADYILKQKVFSLIYSKEKDVILRFQSTLDPVTNKQTITGENIPSLQLIAASFSIPLNITKWWSMQSNLLITHQQVKAVYNNTPLKFQQVNGRINLSENFTLPKDISIELSGYYQSPNISGRYINKSQASLNFGIQKKVQNKKGSIRLNVTDILNTTPWRFEETFPDPLSFTNGRLQFVQRTINLTYSKSFGNDKIKATRVIKGADEEKKRVE